MTGAIAQDRESCQFLSWLMKKPTVVPVGSAGGSREARERFLMEPLALTSSERLHKEPFARLPTAPGRADRSKIGFFINHERN